MPQSYQYPITRSPAQVFNDLGQLIGSVIHTRKITLTSAMLLALKATPQIVIPPFGLAIGIHVLGAAFRYNFATTAYTLNAGTLRLFQGAVAVPVIASVAAGLIDQAANKDLLDVPIISSGAQNPVALENVNLIVANDGAAEFTLGDGTVDVIVHFIPIQIGAKVSF